MAAKNLDDCISLAHINGAPFLQIDFAEYCQGRDETITNIRYDVFSDSHGSEDPCTSSSQKNYYGASIQGVNGEYPVVSIPCKLHIIHFIRVFTGETQDFTFYTPQESFADSWMGRARRIGAFDQFSHSSEEYLPDQADCDVLDMCPEDNDLVEPHSYFDADATWAQWDNWDGPMNGKEPEH